MPMRRWARCAACSAPSSGSTESPLQSENEPTLDELLGDLVAETQDVQVRAGREYVLNGVVFAARPHASSIELRLGPEIADAAMRTPGTGQSSRGTDWILLQPNDWNEARDRLGAWYRVAWRLAQN